jgi:CSLREA domain-containing protein
MVEFGRAGGSARLQRGLIAAGLAATGAALGPVAAASAETITVNSLADDGGGANTTLREAITAANTGAADLDIINFQTGLTGTITLGGSQLLVTDSLDVQGPGAGILTVSGDDASRVFAAGSPTEIPFTLSGLTITEGYGDGQNGGAIAVEGRVDLTVEDCVVSNSKTVAESPSAYNLGGGIYASEGQSAGGGDIAVIDSIVSGNEADGGAASGGGIYTEFVASTYISGSRFTGNVATTEDDYGGGGAISGTAFEEPFEITGSTIDGNSTNGRGGGVYTYGGTVEIDTVTIFGNTAGKNGGGIDMTRRSGGFGGTGVLSNSTIAGNTASNGGGIRRNTNNRPVVTNTIVADNTATTTNNPQANVQGNWQGSFNLLETAPAGFVETVAGSNIIGQDPQLGLFQDNGGAHPTQKPAVAGPAVDKGTGTGQDQRGNNRPVDAPAIANAAGGNGNDIGAVELTSAELVPNDSPVAAFNFNPPSPLTGQAVTFTSTSTDPGGSIASVAWDLDDDGQFDDGTTTPIEHSFATAGDHEVHLRVTDNLGATDTETHVVTVAANPPPTAAFNFAPSDPETDEQVTFTSTSTDPGGSIAGVAWDLDDDGQFDDGTTNPINHSFDVAGDHEVHLRVTDNLGATDEETHVVSVTEPPPVNEPPVAAFHFAPVAPQTGNVVTFDSDATDPEGELDTLEWDLDDDGQFDDGTADQVTTIFTTAGDHEVHLRATDQDDADDVATETVTVTLAPPGNDPPAAAFEYAPANPFTGDVITFTSTSTDTEGPISATAWDFDADGQFDDGDQTVENYTFLTPGPHDVRLRVTDGDSASADIVQTITVSDKPVGPSPLPPTPPAPLTPPQKKKCKKKKKSKKKALFAKKKKKCKKKKKSKK